MKKMIRVTIVGIIAVCLIVWYYNYLENRTVKSAQDEGVNLTDVQKVIQKDLDENYPKTPREVVKFYNKIVTCLYNDDYTEEEMQQMADQQRLLLDQELLDNNPTSTYLDNLKADVADYKDNKKTISNTSVCSTNEVVYKTVDKRECAYVDAGYFLKEGSSFDKTNQRFVLRKDSDGKWKILVFYLFKN